MKWLVSGDYFLSMLRTHELKSIDTTCTLSHFSLHSSQIIVYSQTESATLLAVLIPKRCKNTGMSIDWPLNVTYLFS